MTMGGLAPVPPILDGVISQRRHRLVYVSGGRRRAWNHGARRGVITAAPAAHGAITISAVIFPDLPAVKAAAIGPNRCVEPVLLDHYLADGRKGMVRIEGAYSGFVLFPLLGHDEGKFVRYDTIETS